MLEITLNNSRERAYIDDEDYAKVSLFRLWYVATVADHLVVRSCVGPASENYKSVLLHRFVAGVSDPSVVVHPRDGDWFNCTRENLEILDRSELARGRSARRNKRGEGIYKGTCWRPAMGRWQARIRVDGHEMSLGCFESELEAAVAYDRGVLEHLGSAGGLNFGESSEEEAFATEPALEVAE